MLAATYSRVQQRRGVTCGARWFEQRQVLHIGNKQASGCCGSPDVLCGQFGGMKRSTSVSVDWERHGQGKAEVSQRKRSAGNILPIKEGHHLGCSDRVQPHGWSVCSPFNLADCAGAAAVDLGVTTTSSRLSGPLPIRTVTGSARFFWTVTGPPPASTRRHSDLRLCLWFCLAWRTRAALERHMGSRMIPDGPAASPHGDGRPARSGMDCGARFSHVIVTVLRGLCKAQLPADKPQRCPADPTGA